MITLTSRQRDILKIILEVNKPIGSVELAGRLNLTPRQVNYSMKGVMSWLKQHDQEWTTLPGVGFSISISSELARKLNQEISSNSDIQIILSVSQRQQLLALLLLSSFEPFILSQLQQKAQVSRMTILNDLDPIEQWLKSHQVSLIRKPHYGIQVDGSEQDCQRAIAELPGGPFSNNPITLISRQRTCFQS
jgi:transcriptional antiterminator